jgi:hypothetical protein
LKSSQGRIEIESRATGNQLSMRNLSQNNFKDIDIPMPPLKEQTEIVKQVEALFDKAETIEAAYDKLKKQIDSLPQAILAKAFKGELVEQLPTDGDAKELLKEIAALHASLEKVKKSKGSGRYGTYGRVQRYMNMYIFEYACAHVSAVHVTMSRSHLSHRLVHHRVELLLLKHCSLPRLEFSHPSVQPWLHSTK